MWSFCTEDPGNFSSVMDKTITFLYQESFIKGVSQLDEQSLELMNDLMSPILLQWNGTAVHQKMSLVLLRFSDLLAAEEYIRTIFRELASQAEPHKIQVLFYIFQSDSMVPGLWEKTLVHFARENIPREPGVYCAHKIYGQYFLVDHILYQDGRKIIFKLKEKLHGLGKSRFMLSIQILGLLVIVTVIILILKFYIPGIREWWLEKRYAAIIQALHEKSYANIYSKLKAVRNDSYHPTIEKAIENYGEYLWDRSKDLVKDVPRTRELDELKTLKESFIWSQSAAFYHGIFKSFATHRQEAFVDLYALYAKESSSRVVMLFQCMQILELDPFFLLQSTHNNLSRAKSPQLLEQWNKSLLRSLAFPLPGKEFFYAQLIGDKAFLNDFNFLKSGIFSDNASIQGNTFRLVLIYLSPTVKEILHFLKIQTEAGNSIGQDLERIAIHPKLADQREVSAALREFRDSIIYMPDMQEHVQDLNRTLEILKRR